MDSEQQYYEPLLSTREREKDVALAHSPFLYSLRRCQILLGMLGLQTVAIICLATALWAESKTTCPANAATSQILYSPAQEALEYEPKTFTMGFGRHQTIYQGDPSKEVDSAWNDLYNEFGLSKIPKWQARLLPNKTLPIPGDENNYAVGLAVFHQLHCLNLIRQGLNTDYYRDPVTGAIAGISPEDWPEHLSHCVDNLRQSIMCSADISLIVWQWVEADNRASIMMDTVHSCRNYDKIADWAKTHRRDHHFDMHVHVEDDIEIPVF